VTVEFESPLSANEARLRLRQSLAGPREPVLADLPERSVVGWVQDPSFELVGVGPPGGSVGPLHWRAPARTRRLRGTLVAEDAGSRLAAAFSGAPWLRLARTRREEGALIEWLKRLLESAT
jgi:hypothetical protein